MCKAIPGWPKYHSIRHALLRACDKAEARKGYSEANTDEPGTIECEIKGHATPLSGDEWHAALRMDEAKERVISDLRSGSLPEWGQEIHKLTKPGMSLLEIGSGTGQISLSLARAGRQVTLLDVFQGSLDFAEDCARAIGVAASTVCADATGRLPFGDGSFDCVWSSGLLEHFPRDQVIEMLTDSARVSGEMVVSLVPNANCLAYRLGKRFQEANGIWPFGREQPQRSMRPEFAEAGLRNIEEYSVGALHGLTFLSETSPAAGAIRAWLSSMSQEQMTRANQGYLLLTVGRK